MRAFSCERPLFLGFDSVRCQCNKFKCSEPITFRSPDELMSAFSPLLSLWIIVHCVNARDSVHEVETFVCLRSVHFEAHLFRLVLCQTRKFFCLRVIASSIFQIRTRLVFTSVILDPRLFLSVSKHQCSLAIDFLLTVHFRAISLSQSSKSIAIAPNTNMKRCFIKDKRLVSVSTT